MTAGAAKYEVIDCLAKRLLYNLLFLLLILLYIKRLLYIFKDIFKGFRPPVPREGEGRVGREGMEGEGNGCDERIPLQSHTNSYARYVKPISSQRYIHCSA